MVTTPTIETMPVGNGDMTLIKTANDKTILIDCKYREPKDGIPDVKELLRSRLTRNADNQLYIDVFLWTHPDKDHCQGAESLFHLGKAEDWKEADDKIIIKEFWSSPRVFRRASRKDAENKNNALCEDAKALNKEAKRRANMHKNDDEWAYGDHLIILSEDEDGKTDDLTDIVASLDAEFTSDLSSIDDNSLRVTLLGPAPKQDLDIDEDELSKNNSSVIVSISLRDEHGDNEQGRILSGGDSEVACWEHLWDRLSDNKQTELLNYDVLQAPHHCSWHSLSRDSWSELGEEAVVSDKAKNALSQARNIAFIVSSSRQFGDETPPCEGAKDVYEEILDDVDGQFLCVGDELDDNDKNISIVIEFAENGLEKVAPPINFSNDDNPEPVERQGGKTYA